MDGDGRNGQATRFASRDQSHKATPGTTGDMDPAVKDAIQAAVDRRYEAAEGATTLSVTLIKHLIEDGFDRPVSRNEVEVACDELVEEDRLVFLRDHGHDGRIYCSTAIPAATVELLRESSE